MSIVKELGTKVSSFEKTVQGLEKKFASFEDRSRRNNLLVFGIPERWEETQDSLESIVVGDLFKNKLGIEMNSVERLHRIGRTQPNQPRPVIIKFIDDREKEVC